MCSQCVIRPRRTWKLSAGAGFGGFFSNFWGGTLTCSPTHTHTQNKNFWDRLLENIIFFNNILVRHSSHAACGVLEMFSKRLGKLGTEGGLRENLNLRKYIDFYYFFIYYCST